MDIEKLNKSQIVLLTLLTSFVTSIATGIVTVALMEDAPPAITQTVNRIVERTIETVASEGQMAAAVDALPGEAVLIRESDLLPQAVSTAESSMVRLFSSSGEFAGIGIVVDASGIIVADATVPVGQLTARRSDGVSVAVVPLERRDGAAVAYFQATAAGASADAANASWTPARIAEAPGLGSTVVAIGGTTQTRIAVGVITATSGTEGDDASRFVATDIAPASYAAGSPLVSIDGGLVGIAVGQDGKDGFLAASSLELYNQDASGGE